MTLSTKIHVEAMDCPSEEAMIRMALQNFRNIHSLHADFSDRTLHLIHDEDVDSIMESLMPLNLGARHEHTEEHIGVIEEQKNQQSALISVLIINACCFLLEAVTGFIAGSIGLFADSLDMLADAIVYGLSLLVIAGSMRMKSRIAFLSGLIQLGLGIFGFYECVRRTILGAEAPDYLLMIGISVIAMAGNLLSLRILQKQQSNDPHMRASMMFTSTDVLVNAGVIIAGLLTILSSSMIPDVLIGCIIFILVFRGAIRILRLQ